MVNLTGKLLIDGAIFKVYAEDDKFTLVKHLADGDTILGRYESLENAIYAREDEIERMGKAAAPKRRR